MQSTSASSTLLTTSATNKNMSVYDVCDESGISRPMLYKQWQLGLGPKRFKIGARTFIHRDDYTAWIEALREAE